MSEPTNKEQLPSVTKHQIAIPFNLSEELTSEERQIILASSDIRISDVSNLDIGNIVTDCIDNGLLDLGFKNSYLDQKDRDRLIPAITYDIKKHFKGLTIKDIKNVFALGVRGEFKTRKDELVLITVSNVFNWFKIYIDRRREAFKKQNEHSSNLLKLEDKKIPTPEELLEIENTTKATIIHDYKLFCFNGTPPSDLGNVQYDYLKKKGKICLTSEEQTEYWKLANQEITVYEANKKKRGTVPEAIESNKILAALNESNNDAIKIRILCVAKRIALVKYFQQLKEMEIDIEDLLS